MTLRLLIALMNQIKIKKNPNKILQMPQRKKNPLIRNPKAKKPPRPRRVTPAPMIRSSKIWSSNSWAK